MPKNQKRTVKHFEFTNSSLKALQLQRLHLQNFYHRMQIHWSNRTAIVLPKAIVQKNLSKNFIVMSSVLVGRICADFALNCSFCVKSTKFSEMIEVFILVNT